MDFKTKTPAGRPKRRFWFDPRFAIGLVLVVASVAGVFVVVSSADTSTRVYTARGALAPGDAIDAGDLVVSSVRLASVDELYLVPGDIPDDGLVVTRTVAAGELVPASAVGARAGVSLASVVITLGGQIPASVKPGSTVDLWAASEEETNLFGPPVVIVSGATVVRVIESDGLVASDDAASLELLVPRLRIARVLEAVANDDAMSIVPASIPAKG